MKQLFNINIKKFALLLLPTALRIEELMLLVKALVTPIENIYNQFFVYASRNILLLKFNTSKISVEAMFKQLFGPGIYITQPAIERALYLSEVLDPVYMSESAPDYLYTEGIVLSKETIYLSESEPVYLSGSMPIYLDSFSCLQDFTLNVPSVIWSMYENDIKNYMRLFALPGMVYNYNIY